VLSILCVILPYIKTETKIEPSALTTEYNGFGKVGILNLYVSLMERLIIDNLNHTNKNSKYD